MRKNLKYLPNLLKDLNAQKYLMILVWPMVIWLIIFWLLPLVGVVAAFQNHNVGLGYFKSHWVGLKFFKEMFTDSMFISSIGNTLFYNFLGLIIGFPAPIIFALMLNELIGMNKFKRVVQTISYMPYFLSWAFVASFLITFFSGNGAFNDILQMLGINTNHFSFMTKPVSFISIILGSGLWKGYGISSIMYLAAIATINLELYDAVLIDGASRWQKIRYVTLPCIKPTIVVLLILSISSIVGSNFEQFYLLENSLIKDTARVVDVYTYTVGIQQGRFSYGTAVGLFRSVLSVLLLVTANAISRRVTGESIY
jgi:putative aldouronate transport system permease protein